MIELLLIGTALGIGGLIAYNKYEESEKKKEKEIKVTGGGAMATLPGQLPGQLPSLPGQLPQLPGVAGVPGLPTGAGANAKAGDIVRAQIPTPFPIPNVPDKITAEVKLTPDQTTPGSQLVSGLLLSVVTSTGQIQNFPPPQKPVVFPRSAITNVQQS